jgi:hypothetical protein
MKDTSVIPKGSYCYTWIEEPSKNNNYRGKTKVCPYYQFKIINGVEIPWCDYLNMGGTPGDGKWKGWEEENNPMKKLITYFGSEAEVDEKLSLFLLFDMCKECGENDQDEYYNI